MRLLLLVVLVGLTQSNSLSNKLYNKQLKGIKKLLKGSNSGVFPTCHMVLFSQLSDYDSADEFCKNFDMGSGRTEPGNLATVDDSDKNSDLKMLLQLAYPDDYSKWSEEEWVWAGMRKTSNNVGLLTKKSRKYETTDWEWANGDNPTDFHKWMKKQPDQKPLAKGKQGCEEEEGCYQNQMRINHNGIWDDTFKFKKHPFVCDYHGKYLISAHRKTWLEARKSCEEAGLMLAEVTSAAEVKEIVFLAEYVLGKVDPDDKIFNNTNWLWIGGDDLEEEGEFMWPDHHEVEEWPGMPWRKHQPDNAVFAMEKGEDAMAISRWGEFDDSYEEKRKRPFACMCPHD